MRLLCVVALVLAWREASADTVAREPPPHPSSVAIQAGVLPNVSFVGVELRRVLHPHFEASLSASYGFAAVAAAIARARWHLTPAYVVAAGVGPSVAYEKGGPLEPSRGYIQAVADAELDIETTEQWLLQVRVGVSAHREDHSLTATPFIGLGIGRTW